MKIEAVNIGDIKTGNKNGRDWSLTPCGVKILGKWYNASFFNDKEVERFKTIQANDDIDLILYKEEYNGKEYDKFKFPTDFDLLERRVEMLEQKLAQMLGVDIAKTETTPPETVPEPEEESDDLPF